MRPGHGRQTIPMPVRSLLVANRGEIAVRVFRTCRELGIETVAVAAPDDAGAFHIRSADRLVEIASYLSAEEHVRAAKEAGADAIHPGYGFLAENARFAQAVEAAGLTWVGPPPDALRAGADKLVAKRIAREAGVPILPDGAPDEIGFPLLVKAAAGGGGRGMRVVRSPAELEEARAAAEREAAGAFGDGSALSRALPRASAPCRGAAPCRRARDGRGGRRARLLRAAPPPEGARGGACARPRSVAALRAARGCGCVRPGDRIPRRRHRRVRNRRRPLLLPRAKRPHPGGAPRDRGRQRPRPRRAPDPGRGGRSPCNRRLQARGPRRRGAPLCREFQELSPTGGKSRAPQVAKLQLVTSVSGRFGACRCGRRGGRRGRARL